jgi:hypothetical protein
MTAFVTMSAVGLTAETGEGFVRAALGSGVVFDVGTAIAPSPWPRRRP